MDPFRQYYIAMGQVTAILTRVLRASRAQNTINTFFEFFGTTDSSLVETRKRSKDRDEWAKNIGLKAVSFYKDRISENPKREKQDFQDD
jgi:hypothetical protein